MLLNARRSFPNAIECSWMLSNASKCFRMLLNALFCTTKSSIMLLYYLECVESISNAMQMLLLYPPRLRNAPRCSWMLSNALECSWMLRNAPECSVKSSKLLSRASNVFQILKNAMKCSWMLDNPSRMLSNALECSRMLPTAFECS